MEQELIDLELMGERLRRDGDELETEYSRRARLHLERLARFDQLLAALRASNANERKRWVAFEPTVQAGAVGQQRTIANGGQHGEADARPRQDQKGDGRIQAGHAAQRIAAGA